MSSPRANCPGEFRESVSPPNASSGKKRTDKRICSFRLSFFCRLRRQSTICLVWGVRVGRRACCHLGSRRKMTSRRTSVTFLAESPGIGICCSADLYPRAETRSVMSACGGGDQKHRRWPVEKAPAADERKVSPVSGTVMLAVAIGLPVLESIT